MTATGWLQIALYLALLVGLSVPLGAYMARVYDGRPFGLDRATGWLERLLYRLAGVRPDAEMAWKGYAAATPLAERPPLPSTARFTAPIASP
jgi:K+-transporting ATPase ATPase A chain